MLLNSHFEQSGSTPGVAARRVGPSEIALGDRSAAPIMNVPIGGTPMQTAQTFQSRIPA
jgi:hypothetical protein